MASGKEKTLFSVTSVPGSSPEVIDLLGVGWHEIGADGSQSLKDLPKD